MSELAGFDAYYTHVGGCSTCRPKSGQLCDQGLRLHTAWSREGAKEPAKPGSGKPRPLQVVK